MTPLKQWVELFLWLLVGPAMVGATGSIHSARREPGLPPLRTCVLAGKLLSPRDPGFTPRTLSTAVMDLIRLLRSLEEFLYELVGWLVFDPRMFWRVVQQGGDHSRT